MNEFVTNLFNRFRGEPSTDEVRATFQGKLNEVNAQIEQLSAEYENQMAALRSQMEALSSAYDSNVAPLNGQREELERGLAELQVG